MKEGERDEEKEGEKEGRKLWVRVKDTDDIIEINLDKVYKEYSSLFFSHERSFSVVNMSVWFCIRQF